MAVKAISSLESWGWYLRRGSSWRSLAGGSAATHTGMRCLSFRYIISPAGGVPRVMSTRYTHTVRRSNTPFAKSEHHDSTANTGSCLACHGSFTYAPLLLQYHTPRSLPAITLHTGEGGQDRNKSRQQVKVGDPARNQTIAGDSAK